MSIRYSDTDIERFISEPKALPQNYHSRMQLRDKRGHKGRELDLTGDNGTPFRLILRQSKSNLLDFSVILALNPAGSNQLFRLRRYNGKGHGHTNRIEGTQFFGFHVHYATERYQQGGFREDGYAMQTDRYENLQEALECMLDDCNFSAPQDAQLNLFEGLEP